MDRDNSNRAGLLRRALLVLKDARYVYVVVLTALLSLTGPAKITFAQSPTLVVGHKAPDTDSVVSAIAIANLNTARGSPAEPRVQGDINPETEFVLKKFGVEVPPVERSYAGKNVILVDHSDMAQAPDDIDSAVLVGLIDHHRLGGIRSAEPLEVIIAPVGSTATIVTELYQVYGVAIDRKIASILLAGILSDTRIFKSPTTTPRDLDAAERLSQISGLADLESFGRELLTAYNSSLDTTSGSALLHRDMKIFETADVRFAISQIEMFDSSYLAPRFAELRTGMLEIVGVLKLDAMLLAVTDLDRGGSLIFAVGPFAEKLNVAFEVSDSVDGSWKPGIMSRKKQILPVVERALAASPH